MLMVILVSLLVLLGLLAIPVGLDYRVNWPEDGNSTLHLVWLFGLLRIRIPVESRASRPSTPARPMRARQRKPRARRKVRPLAAWRFKPFRRRILRFVRDLWRAIEKRDVHLQLQIGLGDPADTGRLWAVMGPISAVLACSREFEIDIQPDFTDSRLEIHSSGYIRLVPLQLLGLVLALLLSPPFWLGMQQLRKAS